MTNTFFGDGLFRVASPSWRQDVRNSATAGFPNSYPDANWPPIEHFRSLGGQDQSVVEQLANQAKCLHVITLAEQLIRRGLNAALGELVVAESFQD